MFLPSPGQRSLGEYERADLSQLSVAELKLIQPKLTRVRPPRPPRPPRHDLRTHTPRRNTTAARRAARRSEGRRRSVLEGGRAGCRATCASLAPVVALRLSLSLSLSLACARVSSGGGLNWPELALVRTTPPRPPRTASLFARATETLDDVCCFSNVWIADGTGVTPLFLYNFARREIHGVFVNAGRAGLALEKDAWTTKWPRPAGAPAGNGATPYPCQVGRRVARRSPVGSQGGRLIRGAPSCPAVSPSCGSRVV